MFISILIYKQRHRSPYRKDTPEANYAHVRYIATRPRVLKNEGMNHGLFGKMEPGVIQEFKDWKEIARRVYANSRKNITMYRSVVSFSEETAKELLLTDQKSWQRYIENHIMTIAEKNGVKREHLQWASAVHGEKAHPHIHVVFWDTSVRAKNPYVPPAIPGAIRRQMIKDTFADKIRLCGQVKDESLRSMRKITDEMVDEFERYLRRMKPEQYQEINRKLDEELSYELPFPEKTVNELGSRLLQLRRAIPENGRIAYQLLPPEVKTQVDEMVEDMIRHFPTVRESVEIYCEAKKRQAALYSTDPAYLDQKAGVYEKEAKKVLANRILSGVRMVIRLEGEMRTEQYIHDRKAIYAEQIILESLDILAGVADCEDNIDDGRKAGAFQLSKEARKEWYLKNQDKGYEH